MREEIPSGLAARSMGFEVSTVRARVGNGCDSDSPARVARPLGWPGAANGEPGRGRSSRRAQLSLQ